jgi:DNA-binding protein HU-beta
MKKVEMIAVVAQAAGITKKDAAKAVDAVFEAITTEVAAGHKVTVTGFGTFEPKVREARAGRNPQTGEAITIPAHTAVTFKCFQIKKDLQ